MQAPGHLRCQPVSRRGNRLPEEGLRHRGKAGPGLQLRTLTNRRRGGHGISKTFELVRRACEHSPGAGRIAPLQRKITKRKSGECGTAQIPHCELSAQRAIEWRCRSGAFLLRQQEDTQPMLRRCLPSPIT